MSSGKSRPPSVTVPTYTRPTADNFYSPFGNVVYSDGGFRFGYTNPEDASFDVDLSATRNAILKTIGVTGADREASLNRWQDVYFKEADRLSRPLLEQSLFERGLGGSRFYGDQLTDLISKNTTQAVLNREALRQADEEMKLAQLGQIGNYEQMRTGNVYNLLNLAQNALANQESLATSRYNATLPYLVTYDQGKNKKGYGQLAGAIIGGVGGAFMGNPYMGAQIGSSIGGGIDAYGGRESYGGDIINSLNQAGNMYSLAGGTLPGMGYGGMFGPSRNTTYRSGAFGSTGRPVQLGSRSMLNQPLTFGGY